MQQVFSDDLWRVWLGEARAASTKNALPGLTLQEAAVWNQRLSGAMLSDIGHVEVALRNVINNALLKRFGAPNGFSHWLSDGNNFLAKIGGSSFEARVRDAKASANHGKREPSFDDIIAELSLGFWLNFMSGTYQVFHGDLATAFTGAADRNLRRVRQAGSRLRLLRNRLAHHHRIIHRDLESDWSDIISFANYLDPRLKEFLCENSETPVLVSEFSRKGQAESSSSSHELR